MKNNLYSEAFSKTAGIGVKNTFRSLHKHWKRLASFMVLPEEAGSEPLGKRYAAKTRLYPYLPATEEARDWLEKIYQKSPSEIGEHGK